MAVDTNATHTRRALLAGGLGGIAAAVVSAVGRPSPARAGTDGDVVLGAVNTASDTTTIEMNSSAFPAFYVTSTSGHGIWGYSTWHYGVGGYSISNYGVLASSNEYTALAAESGAIGMSALYARSTGDSTAILGFSGKTWPLPTAPAKTGVYGYAAQDSSARGVIGRTTTGQGVRGQATTGTAIYGMTADPKKGYGLRIRGRVKLDESAGIATVPGGSDRVTVTPGVDLTSTSAVVATLMGDAGGSTTVKRVAVNATTDTFVVLLTADAPVAVKVAWHVFG